MPDLTILLRAVADVSRQIRMRRAEFYGLRGLFGGSLCALLPLILRDSFGWLSFVWAGACLAVGALVGAAVGFFMRLPAGEAARLADRGYGLQDRIATALEWADRPDRTPLVDALVVDAVNRVQSLEGRRVVARRIPREARCPASPGRGRKKRRRSRKTAREISRARTSQKRPSAKTCAAPRCRSARWGRGRAWAGRPNRVISRQSSRTRPSRDRRRTSTPSSRRATNAFACWSRSTGSLTSRATSPRTSSAWSSRKRRPCAAASRASNSLPTSCASS